MVYTTSGPQEKFEYDFLFKLINDATKAVQKKMEMMQANTTSISISDMFAMQLLMNRLSQLSEMSSSVISAAHTATSSMARNVKG